MLQHGTNVSCNIYFFSPKRELYYSLSKNNRTLAAVPLVPFSGLVPIIYPYRRIPIK